MLETVDAIDNATLKIQLETRKPLPTRKNAEELLISFSHVFRQFEEAVKFSESILLNSGESLVAGYTEDSIGKLYWLGVQVDNIERWRANGGFHHVAKHDPEVPKSETL